MRERLLVTVRRDDEAEGRDLEVPAGVPSSELTALVGSALGWSSDYRIRLEPGGRVLKGDESLVQAGALNGTWLVFSAEAPPPTVPTDSRADWPTFLPTRPTTRERRIPLPFLLGAGAFVLLLALAFLLVSRPQPTPVAQPTVAPTTVPTALPQPTSVPAVAPTAVPTPQPTAVPTPAPTVAPTLAPTLPPTAVPTAPPSLPTAVATTVIQDAVSLWPGVLAQLDPIWGRDWPRTIELTQGFLARFPGYGPATDKLYGALVEYGKDLLARGDVPAARAAFEGASTLAADRFEARAALDALAPPPQAEQPVQVSTPPRPPTPVPPRTTPPAPPPEPVQAEPPPKLNVTREGFTPPDGEP